MAHNQLYIIIGIEKKCNNVAWYEGTPSSAGSLLKNYLKIIIICLLATTLYSCAQQEATAQLPANNAAALETKKRLIAEEMAANAKNNFEALRMKATDVTATPEYRQQNLQKLVKLDSASLFLLNQHNIASLEGQKIIDLYFHKLDSEALVKASQMRLP